MKVERSLKVDEIYDKVKDYDLVFTTEAALADALNDRVRTPRLGKLAYTPRTYIYRKYQNRKLDSKRELFLKAVSRLESGWKEASYLLENVIGVWQETGDPREILNFPEFERENVEPVLGLVENTENIYREMAESRVEDDVEVCVVSPYQFDELDGAILPEDRGELDVFTGEEFELSPFRVYSSANQLVGAVVDNVRALDEDQVAVVVHPESAYDPLIRSHFRQAGIEFQVASELRDSEALRTFVSLLELGLNYPRVKLKEAGPVIRRMGLETDRRWEEEYAVGSNSPLSGEVRDLLKDVAGKSFSEVVGNLRRGGLNLAGEVEEVLKEVRLWNEPVNESGLSKFKYFLDSFGTKIEESTGGALMVNPAGATYVDREIVFYLGMSSTWDKRVAERPWREVELARKRDVRNFKSLIQNGGRQAYMVQSEKLNRPVSPSSYFNEIEPKLSSFTDGEEGEDYLRYGRSPPSGGGFGDDYLSGEPDEVRALSQSELNLLVRCPRDYFFSRLVEERDRDYFRKGSVVHDFAEFYANFPDFVRSEGPSRFVDLMVDRMSPIVDDAVLPILRTEFRLAVELLMVYIEGRRHDDIDLRGSTGYRPARDGNFLAAEFDRRIEREFTEMYFLDEEIGGKGKVDLLDGTRIVDYKTGSKVSPSRVVKNSNVDLFEDSPDFQALLYLAHHRRAIGNRELQFTFLHVLDETGRALREGIDPGELTTTVNYYPCTFEDFLTREEVFELVNTSKRRRKLLEPLGREGLQEVLGRLEFDRRDFYSKEKAESHRPRFKKLCEERLSVGRGQDLTEKQLEKAIGSVLRTSLYGLRTGNFFQDDLDRFEEFLSEKLEEVNEWGRTRFPVRTEELADVRYRDLITSGEGR